MKSFRATVAIEASAETIWAVLTDAARYPEWNSTVDRVDGRIAPGEKITVYPKISGGRAFPVKVSAFEPQRRMVWTGGMPLGLFKGERTFQLTPRNGAVEFDMHEVFSGLMAPLIGQSIPNLQPAFDEFAQCLKKKAERN